MPPSVLQSPTTKSFADVAHGTLLFDAAEPADALVLALVDTKWVQRLRNISQTGNTRAVYMFAEHSRFGHSLGVAYLSLILMRHLRAYHPEQVAPYEQAVAAAALLHDIGHVAPGSHLAERVWAPGYPGQHEQMSTRILTDNPEIRGILERCGSGLAETVKRILLENPSLPPWTHAVISGGGWNADRGNWAIVDSTMCAVSYGRYNVSAIIDAFRLTPGGELVIHESRLDALTHFFVARDSMYRQVYQHRVLQALDALTRLIVTRARDLLGATGSQRPTEIPEVQSRLLDHGVFADDTMAAVIAAENYAEALSLDALFEMTEPWWYYHIQQWCRCRDSVLSDLALRIRDRRLLKTIRLPSIPGHDGEKSPEAQALIARVTAKAVELGYDPNYYVTIVRDADAHRGKTEDMLPILLDDGRLVPVGTVEPIIAQLLARPSLQRRWLAVPKSVKTALGVIR